MKPFHFIIFATCAVITSACAGKPAQTQENAGILLKDYRPESVFKLEEHHPAAAKFSAIDMHSHVYRSEEESIKDWDKLLTDNNVERIVIHTQAHGEEFDRLYNLFTGISDKFELWCGFNYDNWGTPEWEAEALADLEHCYNKGAKGVGELGDKGWGETFCISNAGPDNKTAHIDDPLFDKLLEKCAELHMPVSFHTADPIWMYLPMDEKNDGYMNAVKWRIDTTQPGIAGFDELVAAFENAVAKHPNTVFIACHLLNLNHDYARLASILDKYPNLWLDNSARHHETSATPRATKAFYEKYQDRIVWGTDNTPGERMYDLQWRVLQTEDEHFYDSRSYHWPLQGIGVSDDVLKKLLHDNAMKIREYEENR